MFTQCEDRPYAWLICTASLTFGLVVPGATAQVPIETGAKTTLAPGSKDVADKSEGNSELPVLTRDDSERVKKLDERIAKLRKRAEYAEAIPLAQKVLSIRRRVQGDNWWETGDAHLLLKSLEQISALPAHARQELAQAER